MKDIEKILAKSIRQGGIPLITHLKDVASFAEIVARNLNLETSIAYKGAILHDIGKASPLFQQTLADNYQRKPGFVFRHEIASLFFLSLLGDQEKCPVIEMIIAHHKSIYNDVGGKGLLDLLENDEAFLERYLTDFESWSIDALSILEQLGMEIKPITRQQAEESFWEVVDYCESRTYGFSQWKGVLIASDHLVSALDKSVILVKNKMFVNPDLSYYHNRKNELFSLSLISTDDIRPHTLVTAPTGAGKTDFLLRRCKGRVFYTLPFQASINAMYERIKNDLRDTNADIRLLHASSSLKVEEGKIEEKIMQRHIGASIKILTPHQMASLVFATKGYEALIVDLRGCDVILDEIHTYSETTQAIVLKIVEILVSLNCRIHIGTATMPIVLYNRLLEILGGQKDVYEVKLPDEILDTYDRHIIHKVDSIESLSTIIGDAINNKQKILFVCNQVKRAQQLYEELKTQYPGVSGMLVHSRFKREDRNRLETELRTVFNITSEACFVVSTQVVEVSLDISFDLMVTECAPIDALIQRFGRINRKRDWTTIGKYKPIYVLSPSVDKSEALPYDLDVLKKNYQALPNGELFKEREVQKLIDSVYSDGQFVNIDLLSAFKNKEWLIKELWHNPKSALLETLEIDSVTCIDEYDRELYESTNYETQSKIEIPVSFRSVGFNNLDKSKIGSKPFIIPHKAYDAELGLLVNYAKPEYYDVLKQFL